VIKWQYFPKSKEVPIHLKAVIDGVFAPNSSKIDSRNHKFESSKVLNILRKDLEGLGFIIEKGKGKSEKIRVPVLFGEGGRAEKAFDVDGWNKDTKSVIEVEAGRGVTNYQFLKDLFQACVMQDVNYLIVCIRNGYRGHDNFGTVVNFFNTLYASDRLSLPLAGIMVVGY
jgi:hypothetical protein